MYSFSKGNSPRFFHTFHTTDIFYNLFCLGLKIILILFLISQQLYAAGGQEPKVALSTQAYPQRIASLTLFTDELLFDLVSIERIAAITYLASDSVYSNVADRAKEIETQIELNVEVLIDLDPDIIFVANWSDAGKIDILKEAGLKIYLVDTPTTIEGIKQEIFEIGSVLGAEDAAEAIILEMDAKFATLAVALATITKSERRTAIDYNNWGASSGSNTTWGAILESAKVDNALSNYQTDRYGQVPVSKELLIELDPDVLFLPGWVWGDPDGADAFEAEVRSDTRLAGLKALREDRLYILPESLKTTYSHYIADSAEAVAKLVYPEYF